MKLQASEHKRFQLFQRSGGSDWNTNMDDLSTTHIWIALSSGSAEFCGMVRGATRLFGLGAPARDMDFDFDSMCDCGATALLRLAFRSVVDKERFST